MAETVLNGMLTMNSGEKVVVLPGVADITAAMQRFGWPDYIMFILMLLICVGVGLYFAFHNQDTQDYLMGGRKMALFPVSLSLIASFISGISLLGIPTEVYLFGIQYIYALFGVGLMALIFNKIYLPVVYNLNITSTYEYHERRFDKKVRLLASFLYTIEMISFLPIAAYVPALAFNQVTGVNVHLITPIICVICIFYTTMGGLKAVVWTDVLQAVIMYGAMVIVAIKGTADLGGISKIWERNIETGRIELPSLDLNPVSRHTIWSLSLGSCFYFLQQGAVCQTMMQRYLSLPSLNQAKRASWLYFLGMCAIYLVCGYCGLLMYATFYECDPLTTMLAREKDQLLPLLVMDVLGDWPGLLGIFIAGILSASLSSLSSGLNSMAVVVLEDFCKMGLNKTLTERQSSIITKLSVIIFGAISLGLVYVVEKLGTVLQLTMSIGTIASGPSLGLFTMGILFPWVNAKGALVGATSSLLFMSWVALRAQAASLAGDLLHSGKAVTTEGCHYHFTPKQSPMVDIHFNTTLSDDPHDEIFMLFRLSYLWYTLLGVSFSVIIGLLVSYATKPLDPRDVDPNLLAPWVRSWIAPRIYPNEPEDGLIFAYKAPQNLKKDGQSKVYGSLKVEEKMQDTQQPSLL